MQAKSIRVHGFPPKSYAAKVSSTIHDPLWDENKTAKWIKETFSGTVWFDAVRIENQWRQYKHHVQTLWFKNKRDAMIYRLTVKDSQ